jgi:hypothetical protein
MAPINPQDAQTQVNSYVNMHCTDPNPIYSVTIDANMLRDYLNCVTPNAQGQSGTQASSLKFIFAHDLGYAQSRAAGTLAPEAPEVLSFVLGGFDVNGNYILDQNNMIFNQMGPCPTECPPLGQAACTYLQLSKTDLCNPPAGNSK